MPAYVPAPGLAVEPLQLSLDSVRTEKEALDVRPFATLGSHPVTHRHLYISHHSQCSGQTVTAEGGYGSLRRKLQARVN